MGKVNELARIEYDNLSEQEIDRAEAYHRPRRQSKAPPGVCKYCDELRDEGTDFHPPHDASQSCESGNRAHCSCDTCF